jgi:hypothetical protein
MDRFELAVLWTAALFSALVGLTARIAWLLYGPQAPEPPEDPAQLAAWKRKRLWVTISEFSALPLLATCWLAVMMWWPLSPALMVLGCMASGALGFGFLLNALQTVLTRRIKNV